MNHVASDRSEMREADCANPAADSKGKVLVAVDGAQTLMRPHMLEPQLRFFFPHDDTCAITWVTPAQVPHVQLVPPSMLPARVVDSAI